MPFYLYYFYNIFSISIKLVNFIGHKLNLTSLYIYILYISLNKKVISLMQTENTLQTNNPTTETPQSTKKKFSFLVEEEDELLQNKNGGKSTDLIISSRYVTFKDKWPVILFDISIFCIIGFMIWLVYYLFN